MFPLFTTDACFQFECAFLRTSVTCVAAPKVHLCLCAASAEAVAAHTVLLRKERQGKKIKQPGSAKLHINFLAVTYDLI